MLKPSIETHNVNGILVAGILGKPAAGSGSPVQDLRGHYEAHLKNQGTADVVIDLSGVGFAGSAALGNFVALQRLVRAKGGRIVFCNVDPTVTEVFRASKLDSLFGVRGRSSRRGTSHQRAAPHRSQPDREKGPPATQLTPRTRRGPAELAQAHYAGEATAKNRRK